MIVFLIVAAVILVLYLGVRFHIGMVCWTYELTGWYCPGCGLTRAVRAMFKAQWYQAFRYNVLLMPCIIPGVVILIISAIQYIKNGELENTLVLNLVKKWYIPIVIILLLYAILRNIFPVLGPCVV